MLSPALTGPSLPVPNTGFQGFIPVRNTEWLKIDNNISIALHSGELAYRSADVSIAAQGMDLEIRRVYRSQIDYEGPFGTNGSHNWDQKIEFNGSTLTHLDGERLTVDTYLQTSDGWRCQTPGVYRKARLTSGGVWEIRERAGSIRRFRALDGSAAEGRIDEYADPSGNTISCTYTNGNLSKLTDAGGRDVTLSYSPAGYIRYVLDWGGRLTGYSYKNANLVTVTLPSVTGTPTGPDGQTNDFPTGRKVQFDYDSGDNLISVIYPQQVADLGLPAVTFTYTSDAVSGVTRDGSSLSLSYQNSSTFGVQSTTTLTDFRGIVSRLDFRSEGQLLASELDTAGVHPGDPASFEHTFAYNSHGERTSAVTPSGKTTDFAFDDSNSDLFQHGNLLSTTENAPSGTGQFNTAWQSWVTDPVYGRTLTTLEAGDKVVLDYQEATPAVSGLQTLINDWDINTGSFDLSGLGDQNGDSVVNQIAGKIIRKESEQITTGVTTPVTIIKCSTFDSFGRLITTTSGEGTLRVQNWNSPANGGTLASYIDDADPATSPPNAGTTFWSKPSTVDHIEAQTTFGRDTFGRVTRVTDPRGVETAYVLNAYGEVLKVTEGDAYDAAKIDPALAALVSAGYSHLVAPQFETWHRYDANGNQVVSIVQDSGSGAGDGWLTTTRDFNTRGLLESETHEVSPTKDVTWSFQYDAEGQQTRITRPEGDYDTWTYDERGYLFEYTAGASDVATASTLTYTYDLNGNPVEVAGPDDLDGDGNLDVVLQEFDGRDRFRSRTDPVGTKISQSYDNHDFNLGYLVEGQTNGPSPTGNDTSGNVALAESTQLLDEIQRVVKQGHRRFLASPISYEVPYAVTDVWTTTTMEYDRDSRVVKSTDSEGRTTAFTFDGLGRNIGSVDPAGNAVAVTYDASGLLVLEEIVEVNPLNPSLPETKSYSHVYDGLGRLIRSVDSTGRAKYYAYDARGNRTATTDARNTTGSDPLGLFAGSLNGPGNTKRFVYDGVGRTLASYADNYANGEGSGSYDLWAANFDPSATPTGANGSTSSSYVYDDNGNVETVTAGSGDSINFDYDDQNRVTHKAFPDGSRIDFTYYKNGAIKLTTTYDGNQVVFRSILRSYDSAGRHVKSEVLVPSGAALVGTTQQTFEYNGLDHMTLFTDDNGAGPDSTVERIVDSMGGLLWEETNSFETAARLDETGRISDMFYSGSKVVSFTRDAAGRLDQVTENGVFTIADYSHFGRSRPAEIAFGNGLRQGFAAPLSGSANITGYDAQGRPQRKVYDVVGGSTLSEMLYTYDRNGGRIEAESLITGAPTLSDLFTYDSMGRITAAGIDLFGGAARDLLQLYGYQGDSNLDSLSVKATGSPTSTYALANDGNYGYDSIASQTITHDVAGNRISDQWMNYHFDAFDRLVRINVRNLNGTDGASLVEYAYDALGRRIQKSDIVNSKDTKYAHFGDRVVREYSGTNQVLAEYVYGEGIDEVLQMIRNTDGDPTYERYFYLSGGASSIVALTDELGAVVERYSYDPSGFVRFLNPDGSQAVDSGTNRLASLYGNPYLFQGREYDHEIAEAKFLAAVQGYVTEWSDPSGLYYFRARYYDPAENRFVSRDKYAPASNNGLSPNTLIQRMYKDGFMESPYVRGNNNPTVLDPMGNSYWLMSCETAEGILDTAYGAARLGGKIVYGAGKLITTGIAAGAVSFTTGVTGVLAYDDPGNFAYCASAFLNDNAGPLKPEYFPGSVPEECKRGIVDLVLIGNEPPPPSAPTQPQAPHGPGTSGPQGPGAPGPSGGGKYFPPAPTGPGTAGPQGPGAPGQSGQRPTTPGPAGPPAPTGTGTKNPGETEPDEPKPEGPWTGPNRKQHEESFKDEFWLGDGTNPCETPESEDDQDNGDNPLEQAYLPGLPSPSLASFHAQLGDGSVALSFSVLEGGEYRLIRDGKVVRGGNAAAGTLVSVTDVGGTSASSYSLVFEGRSGQQFETGKIRPLGSHGDTARAALEGLLKGIDSPTAVASEVKPQADEATRKRLGAALLLLTAGK